MTTTASSGAATWWCWAATRATERTALALMMHYHMAKTLKVGFFSL
ncbi:MAG: hypothetical protein ACLSHJ_07005 [Oscillospiraceae bacterium]